MDDFDDDEWAEMQEMYINHTFKELTGIKENLESIAFDSLMLKIFSISQSHIRGHSPYLNSIF